MTVFKTEHENSAGNVGKAKFWVNKKTQGFGSWAGNGDPGRHHAAACSTQSPEGTQRTQLQPRALISEAIFPSAFSGSSLHSETGAFFSTAAVNTHVKWSTSLCLYKPGCCRARQDPKPGDNTGESTGAAVTATPSTENSIMAKNCILHHLERNQEVM